MYNAIELVQHTTGYYCLLFYINKQTCVYDVVVNICLGFTFLIS